MPVTHTGSFRLSFKNEHYVYENEVRCVIQNTEFNSSYNPTLVTNYLSGSLKDFATGSALPSGSYFTPYATSIGLYNDNNELLAVAKLSRPLLKDFTKEALVRVKLDF